MHRNRSADILKILDRESFDGKKRGVIWGAFETKLRFPKARSITPASEWSNSKFKGKLSESEIAIRFKPDNIEERLRKARKVLPSNNKTLESDRLSRRSRQINTESSKDKISRIRSTERSRRFESKLQPSSTLYTTRRSNKLDEFCSRLDKRLQTKLPFTSKSRELYTIIKPYDFLAHQDTKSIIQTKPLLGNTFNFTKTRVCHPAGQEDPSTRKLKENLRSLEHKVQACKHV